MIYFDFPRFPELLTNYDGCMVSRAEVSELVVVFLKYPEVGRVKTRLAAAVGGVAAAEIYRELVGRTLAAVGEWLGGEPEAGAKRHVWIYCTPGDRVEATQSWLRRAVLGWKRLPQWVVQPEGDLGGRLGTVFDDGFAAGFSSVCAIGTDCPALSAEFLAAAAALLCRHPGVIGPTEDGGYYLIGLNSPRPEIFRNIPWSSPETRSATVAAARLAGWELACLPVLSDVDTHTDWVRWRKAEGAKDSKKSAAGRGNRVK